jgi:hypothetical protein
LHRPLRAIGASRPPVGALDVTVHRDWNSILEQHRVQYVWAIRIEPARDRKLAESQIPVQGARGAAFVTFRITQQHQRLFCWIMQPGVKLCLP